MSTKNIVPRADGEGSLGTAAKRWGNVQTKKVTSEGAVNAGSVTAGGITATGEISGTTAEFTGAVNAGSVTAGGITATGEISGTTAEFTGAVNAGSVTAGGIDVANLLASGAAAHNAIFRGKNLGSSVTPAQWAAIQAGTFDDLYIGDYWTINGIEWVIVAFDYYYNTGDTACTTHHVVVIPRTNLYKAQMNTENVTTGAYVGSKMYTENLNQAKTTIQNAFGASHLLSIRQHFQNATTNGYESGGTWYDATVWLMSEANVYGGNVFKSVINGTGWPNLYSIDNRQYPYFRFALPNEKRAWYWLRDVANSSLFAGVGSGGNSSASGASSSDGVRPAFCIKAS